MSLLELRTSDLLSVKKELEEKVRKAPAFFKHSPVVLGLEQLSSEEQNALDLDFLHTLCRELGLTPTAVRGATAPLVEQAHSLGIAALPRSRPTTKEAPSASVEAEPNTIERSEQQAEQSAPTDGHTETSPHNTKTRIVTAPIRSGQQIYAKGGDLIVMSQVSAGAEVLADGNIHIYGALRGRALAGIQGDESARIFCTSQEAELVSVAGQFLVDEILRNKHWKEAVQIFFEDGRLTVLPLS